jgi:hypothetical protein
MSKVLERAGYQKPAIASGTTRTRATTEVGLGFD